MAFAREGNGRVAFSLIGIAGSWYARERTIVSIVLTGSSTFSFPRSSSSRTDAAVNCLVSDPRRNFVAGVLGMFHSRLAAP